MTKHNYIGFFFLKIITEKIITFLTYKIFVIVVKIFTRRATCSYVNVRNIRKYMSSRIKSKIPTSM